MKKDGYVLVKIDGKIRECKVIYSNDINNTLRIEYATYHNGRYNGIEQTTITKDDIYIED